MERARSSSRSLSVSSNGSNGLRPLMVAGWGMLRRTFSILERIEWAATDSSWFVHFRPSDFQYPRTDRMGCDWETDRGDWWYKCFQYPRTDRMGCDRRPRPPPANHVPLSVSSNGSNGLRRLVDLLQKSCDGELEVMDGSDQVETQSETLPTITVPLAQNAKDLQSTDNVLNQDAAA